MHIFLFYFYFISDTADLLCIKTKEVMFDQFKQRNWQARAWHTDTGAGWVITALYYDFIIIITFHNSKENSVFIQLRR